MMFFTHSHWHNSPAVCVNIPIDGQGRCGIFMNSVDQNFNPSIKVPILLVCLTLLATIWITAFTPTTSEAKSRTCVRLERQLAQLSSGRRSKNPLKLLRYNSAIKRQKTQIKQANRQIRRGGCANGQVRNPLKRGLSCRQLKSSLGKMNINLKKLRVQRNKYSSKGGSSSRERRRIKKALRSNRCNNLRPVTASNRSGVLIERRANRRSIIEQIYGDERRQWDRRNRYREYYDDEQDYPGSRPPRGGTYRTLCVRTCDGYYFPISFSTTPRNFDRDAASCSAKCPGTETELYHYSTNGEEAEDMLSVSSDQPYKDLPTAFSYRTAVTPGCGCNFKQVSYDTVAGEGNDSEEKPAEEALGIPTPTFRIDPGEDPDTLANQRGNFVPKPLMTKQAKANKSGKRKVRVVGEVFFPGQ